MAATVLHPFSECIGIEILEGLHALALDLLVTFDDKVRPKMGRSTHTGTYVGVNVCLCARVYMCVYVCFCKCVCVDGWMDVSICVYVSVCV